MPDMPDHAKEYLRAQERECIDPELGKYLDDFNELMGWSRKKSHAFYRDVYSDFVNHLLKCRPCRKHLSLFGQAILSKELFWSGYFLTTEEEKAERKKELSKIKARASPRQISKWADEFVGKCMEEPWFSERKKIRDFIEN